MIIIKLYGGLGNQFFQYATARSMALQGNTCVALDLSWFDLNFLNQTKRESQINHYKIRAKNWNSSATWLERSIMYNKYGRRIFLYLNRIPYIKEDHFDVGLLQLNTSKDFYLDGYWQNYQYFKNIRSTLQDELRLNHDLDEKNQALIKNINQNNSIALHVRRGDYVNNPLSIHRVLDLSYYQKAICYISERVSNPFFYIFSDDPQWCKQNFNFENMQALFLEHNVGTQSYKDLELMKHCNHFITANSTFSWWAAWLGAENRSIVITPKKWFTYNWESQKLIPNEWIKI